MGRGLSDLQKAILRIALRQQEAHAAEAAGLVASFGREPSAYGCDVQHKDVLAEHFGFQKRKAKMFSFEEPDRFDRQAIGPAIYNRAEAALSRAIVRLESRGLVHRAQGAVARWSGATLTDEGLRVARELSVNTRKSLGHVNR